MFKRTSNYYRRDFTEVKEFKEYDLERLKKTLPKERGAEISFSLPNRVKNNNKSKEFWTYFGKAYKNYQYSAIKMYVFDETKANYSSHDERKKEMNSSEFELFLDKIEGEVTEFHLILGKPSINIISTAIENNISVLQINSIKYLINKNKWITLLKILTEATMLKLLKIYEISKQRIIDILSIKSEIQCLMLWPAAGKGENFLLSSESHLNNKIPSFLKDGEVLKKLESLKKTIFYPCEIKIGYFNTKVKSSNGRALWVDNYENMKLKKVLDELNKRKETEDFWRKVIAEAIRTKKMTRFCRSKLMFIGKGRAGKTSTIRSLLDQPFQIKEDSTKLADAKGIIKIVIHDVHVNTWKPRKLKGALIHKEDLVERLRAAREDVQESFVNSDVHIRDFLRDERENGNIEARRIQIKDIKKIDGAIFYNQRLQRPRFRKNQLKRGFRKGHQRKNGGFGMFNFADYEENLDLKDITSQMLKPSVDKKEINAVNKKKKKPVTRTISLWDFGGQEVFYTVHHLFLTNNGVYVMVFDFEQMMKNREPELANIKFWIDSVTLYAAKAPLFIVATHVNNFTMKDFQSINEEVIVPLIEEYVDLQLFENPDDDLSFYLIENSDENVEMKKHQVLKLRESIEQAIKETASLFKEYSRAVPLAWVYFMNHLIKGNTLKLTYEMIKIEAEKVNFQKEDIENMLKLYSDFGTILSFREDPNANLSEHIILSPQWLVDALKTFIYDKKFHHRDRLKKPELNDKNCNGDVEIFEQRDKNYKVLKNERSKLSSYEKSGILPYSTYVKLLHSFSKTDQLFLEEFFKKMFLISEYGFDKVEKGEKKSKWFVPSMCKITKEPKGFDKFVAKNIDNSEILIHTDRRQPKGFYERVVCLFLKESNRYEGALKPQIGELNSIIYLFRDYPIAISNTNANESVATILKRRKPIKEINKESNEGSYIRIIFQNLKQREKDTKLILETTEKILRDIKADTLGSVLGPEIVLVSDEDEDKKSYRVFLKDLRAAIEKDLVQVKLYNRPPFVDVDIFSKFVKLLKKSAKTDPVSISTSSVEKEYDCFIAHEWGTKEDEFSSHEAAKKLKKRLKNDFNFKVWIDEEKVKDKVISNIIEGVNTSIVIILLITKRYLVRCEDMNTMASLEFHFAKNKKDVANLIPIVVDDDLRNPEDWIDGVVKFTLPKDILFHPFINEKDKEAETPRLIARIKKLKKTHVLIKKCFSSVKELFQQGNYKSDAIGDYVSYSLIKKKLKVSDEVMKRMLKMGGKMLKYDGETKKIYLGTSVKSKE